MQAHVPQARGHLIRAKVEDYYRLIDEATKAYSEFGNSTDDVPTVMEEMLALFADSAVYNRAGQLLEGKEAIRKFYTSPAPEGRVGLEGKHSIKNLVSVDSSTVLVRGEFTKVNDEIIPFMDVWKFNLGARTNLLSVVFRETYLLKGSETIVENISTDRSASSWL